jgi:hypothetical protein
LPEDPTCAPNSYLCWSRICAQPHRNRANSRRGRFRDAHVGPDAPVWAAGRQPGGSLLRDGRLPNWQLVIIPVCFPSNAYRWLAIIPEAELRSAGQTGRLPLREAGSRPVSKRDGNPSVSAVCKAAP